jgi:hypothetical protein
MKQILVLFILMITLQTKSASIMRYTEKQKNYVYQLYKNQLLKIIEYSNWYDKEYCGCEPKFSPNIER